MAKSDDNSERSTVMAVLNWTIFIGLAFLLLVNLYNLIAPQFTLDATGQKAPDFALKPVGGGEKVALSDHRGKVVLLDFWATWCDPCRKQMPVVQTLHEDESLQNLEVLSINTDQGSGQPRRDRVEQFLSEGGYTFTTLLGTPATMTQYKVSSIPALIVVDPKGRIQHAEVGIHSEDEIRQMVESAR